MFKIGAGRSSILSAYEACFLYDLRLRKLKVEPQTVGSFHAGQTKRCLGYKGSYSS